MFINQEQLKKYFWSLFSIIGVVLFWIGVWEGIGGLPYISNPFISLGVGLLMFTLSGVIFKEFNPLQSVEKSAQAVLQTLSVHPQKHEFHIKYKDKIKNKEFKFKADKFKKLEKDFLVFLENGKEIFIPVHRVTEVLHKNKTHWKA